MSGTAPILVRGFSRSGGTLLVTILDAHPAIAMSYELYPKLLMSRDGPPRDLMAIARILGGSWRGDLQKASLRIQDRDLRTFVARCARSGLDTKILSRLLRGHCEQGLDFSTPAGRLRFMERCCREKMTACGKKAWGLKCSNSFEEYLTLWPDTRFLNVVRDGRDVLASQLKAGSFHNTPEEVGVGWANTHRRFRELMHKPGVRACEVFYEKLATNPEGEVRRVCGFLDVPFCESMLSFHRQDLSIYRSSHLSIKRISQPVDSSKIGRWKKDLDADQLRRFCSTAGEMMTSLGYLTGGGELGPV